MLKTQKVKLKKCSDLVFTRPPPIIDCTRATLKPGEDEIKTDENDQNCIGATLKPGEDEIKSD